MRDPDREVWEDILAYLQHNHPTHCRNWFTRIDPLGIADGSILLRAGTDVHRDYLRRECLEIFNDAARTVTNSLIAVRFLGPDDLAPRTQHIDSAAMPGRHAGHPRARGDDADKAHAAGNSQTTRPDVATGRTASAREPLRRHVASEADLASLPGSLSINPDHGFDNFVVGPNNRLAHAAAIAVASDPGRAYNPYFVHGGVGLGKTHLLQAICVAIKTERPGTVIHYVSCDEFISDFMNSVQAGRMSEFRHRFRDVDVLVIDDIHFLANRDRTQEEFFHTFNSLYQANKQIVLSSDAPPEEIPHLEDRLVSRFKWGLVAKIDPPSYETRVAIIHSKARIRGVELSDDVACYLAERENSVRELEGDVRKLLFVAEVDKAHITVDFARGIFGVPPPRAARVPTIEDIITSVCSCFEVKRSELLSKRRYQSISLPRQICMYLARNHTRHSLEEVGGHFGGRDHTTVLHAVRAIDRRRTADPQLAGLIAKLESQIASPRD